MRKLAVMAAFLTALVAGCGASNTATQNTSPEETTTSTGTTAQSTQLESAAETAPAPEKTTAATTGEPATGWVSAMGDSVMIGAIEALEQEIPNLGLLNAQGSRQPSAAIDLLQRWRAAGYLGDAVVIDIGNNGPFSSEQFDEMMEVLAGVPKVLIVSLTVPPGVEDPVAASNNAVLTDGVQRYSNTVLVDWHAASAEHPEYFSGEDNIHLSLQGAQAYAELITTHLGDDDAAEGSVAPPGSKERITWGEGGAFGECVGPSSWCSSPD
jgi:hypothetical protein